MAQFGPGPTKVEVRPNKSPMSPGGVTWTIFVDGMNHSSSINYKKDAVKEARKIARRQDGKLKIYNKKMNISETASYS